MAPRDLRLDRAPSKPATQIIAWGLAVVFLPIATFAFLVLAWRRAKPPFLFQIYGVLLVLAGVFLVYPRR